MYSIKQSVVAVTALLVILTTIAMFTTAFGYGQGEKQSAPKNQAENVNVVNMPTVNIGNTTGAPVPVRSVDTHVGRPTTDLVTLNRLGSGTLRRISAEGVSEGVEFVVPSGQIFVVTDFSWTAGGDPATLAGSSATFRLLNGSAIVHVSPATLGSNGQGGSSEDMTTGIAFGAGSQVRWQTTTANAFDVSVHGYLIDAD